MAKKSTRKKNKKITKKVKPDHSLNVALAIFAVVLILYSFNMSPELKNTTQSQENQIEQQQSRVEKPSRLEVPAHLDACNDADGKDYFTKGKMITSKNKGANTDSEYIDYCEGKKVVEYYCQGDMAKSVTHFCEKGCNDGACIKA